MFDNKSCLWNYLNEATQISHVTQEPICPRLVNMTYSPASVLITVSGEFFKLLSNEQT